VSSAGAGAGAAEAADLAVPTGWDFGKVRTAWPPGSSPVIGPRFEPVSQIDYACSTNGHLWAYICLFVPFPDA